MSPAFREFASLFHERVFVNLVCYADESGTHDVTGIEPGSQVALIGGCIALKDEWAGFNEEWGKVLDSYRVPVLHMSEFNAQEWNPDKPSPYLGWSREKRDCFIKALIEVVRDFPIYKIGRAVHVKEYNAICSDRVKAFFRHPWHFCFWMLLSEFADKGNVRLPGGLRPDERIAFFFEQQDEFSDHAMRIFNRFVSRLGPEHLLGSIAFVPKEKNKYVPLQAADLVAFRMRKVETRAKNKRTGMAELRVGTWDDALLADSRTSVAFYDADSLQRIQPRLIDLVSTWID